VIATFIAEAEAAPDELSTIANAMVAPPLPFIPEEVQGRPWSSRSSPTSERSSPVNEHLPPSDRSRRRS
jgi:hypothetical protein